MRVIHVGKLDRLTLERLKHDASASVWPMCAKCGAPVFVDYSFGSPRPFKHEVHHRTQSHADRIMKVIAVDEKNFVMQILLHGHPRLGF